jgi:heme oxygenase
MDARNPLRQQLRDHTASAHARLDQAFAGGFPDESSYRGYLRGMAVWLRDAAQVLGASHWLLARVRPALAADLGEAMPADAAAAPPALPRRLGWEYVLSGATLGARVLQRDASRLGHDAGSGGAFLHAYCDSGAWPRFLGELERMPLDPPDRGAACAGATEAFRAAERALLRASGACA